MTEKGISRRKLLAGAATIGAASAAGGAGTFAYLSDSGSSEFSFLTGSLNVQTTPDTLDFPEDEENPKTATVEVVNNGSLPARQVVWTSLSISGSDAVAKAMEVQSIKYRGSGIGSAIQSAMGTADQNGNGIFDLHDIASFLG